MTDPRNLIVDVKDEGLRLDIHLAKVMSERFSRSQIKKLIDEGSIKVNQRVVSPHYRVKQQDEIEILMPEIRGDENRAENIPIEILHEDDDIIVVNKPAGMVVHPACGNPRHTLVNALLFHAKGLSNIGGAIRPGIVHRLDKDTSGVMVIAKNDRAHGFIARQFKKQTVERIYRVVVRGQIQHDEGIIEEPVGRAFLNRKKVVIKPSGGKDATTYFKVLKRYKKATLLEVRPQTGRTHQIRVHMVHLGHPVLGDTLYGVPFPGIDRQCVHALALGFVHPTTKEKVFFQTELPADIQNLLGKLD